MSRKFGTDGIRGKAGVMLTPELAYRLGLAAAVALSDKGKEKSTILIGKDTRISGDMLESALAAGLVAAGVDVVLLGVIPTPGVAALLRHLHGDAAAVISASHNPYYDNGIKFFARGGYKLPDEVEDQLEALMDDPQAIPRATDGRIGRIHMYPQAIETYAGLLLQQQSPDLQGMKIALDCANGASYQLMPALLRRLGAEVTVCGDRPNGVNINDHCGSTHLAALQKLVLQEKADLGLAFDGDADRLLAIDETGEEVDGDHLLAIIATWLKEQDMLTANRIVVTQMSNMGLKLAMEKIGVEVEDTKVGDRYVLERMLATGAAAGGEQSGHLILSHYNTTGDGPAAALQLLRIIREYKKPLSQLKGIMERLPQVLVNVKVAQKEGWQEKEAIRQAIAAGEADLNGQGRILLRPSGTEPVIRVMAEGRDLALLESVVDRIARAVDASLN
ncbi:MAG: phosphoglucosamine mutase [Firmicutes bacterium]|nr:phosphoglucosamine mutase [Bacillota bacterium]